MPDKPAQYSDKEAQERFNAALRGAMNTPPSPRKSMTPKRPKKQRKPRRLKGV